MSAFPGERPFPAISVPVDITPDKLRVLLVALLKEEDDEDETAERPFNFYLSDRQIESTLDECMKWLLIDQERTVPVIFKPQSVFR